MDLFYKVVNRDWDQSLPESFGDFNSAMNARKEWDSQSVIECHSSDGVEVVYDPIWEELSMGNDLFLNNNTPLKLVSKN